MSHTYNYRQSPWDLVFISFLFRYESGFKPMTPQYSRRRVLWSFNDHDLSRTNLWKNLLNRIRYNNRKITKNKNGWNTLHTYEQYS